MRYKDNLADAKAHWRAFWEHEVIDRPCLCVTAPRRGAMPAPPWITHTEKFFAVTTDGWDALLPRFDAQFAATWYGGDAMPQLDVTLGPDEYAAFLGGAIEARRDHITTWSHPVWDSLEGRAAALDLTPDGYWMRFRRSLRELAAWTEDRCCINQLDYHSHFDALCALRGPEELCMDLLDDPDGTSRVLDTVAATYPAIFEGVYEDGRMAERGCTCWTPHYLESGRFAVVCCDFSCLLSPAQNRRFVLPYVEQEIAYLDRNVYHLDGKDSLVHLDDLLAIERLDCIQWVPGDGAPRSIEQIDLLRRIQAAGKSVWIYDWTPDEIRARFRELDPALTVFSVSCATQDDGERLLEDVKL